MKRPYKTQAEYDRMLHHHVIASNGASACIERARCTPGAALKRLSIYGEKPPFYDCVVYQDGSLLVQVDAHHIGASVMAVTPQDLEDFSGFTPEMMSQLGSRDCPFTH